MRLFLDNLYRASGWIAAAFLAAICALVFVQVILNLIDRISTMVTGTAIGLTIPSYADFTGFFLAAASFFALAFTLRQGGHIRVTLFIQRAGPKLRRVIEFWCVALVLFFTVYFTWYMGLLTYDSYSYNDLSSGMIAVPIWIPQAGMLAGLLVLVIALADELVSMLLGAHPSYEGKEENLLEGD